MNKETKNDSSEISAEEKKLLAFLQGIGMGSEGRVLIKSDKTGIGNLAVRMNYATIAHSRDGSSRIMLTTDGEKFLKHPVIEY